MNSVFGSNGCSMQMNRENCEKRTSLITSAYKCSEHSAFESMWLSTNVNGSAKDGGRVLRLPSVAQSKAMENNLCAGYVFTEDEC